MNWFILFLCHFSSPILKLNARLNNLKSKDKTLTHRQYKRQMMNWFPPLTGRNSCLAGIDQGELPKLFLPLTVPEVLFQQMSVFRLFAALFM